MSAFSTDQSEKFLTALQELYGKVSSSQLFQKHHAKAWEHFLSLGLPTRDHELYRYVPVRHLFSQTCALSTPSTISLEQIVPHVLPNCQNSCLVLVNGHYQPSLSSTSALADKIVLLPLQEANRTYSALLNNQWTKSLKEEKDPFSALNAALHRDGCFIYLPPRSIVEAPIQVLNIIDAENAPLFITPRINLFAGINSSCSLVVTTAVMSGSQYCFNQAVEIAIEDNAHINLYQLARGIPESAWYFDATRATLKRNSTFKTVCITEGSASVRHDYRVALTGENAEASLNGLWNLEGKREAHTNVLIEHQAPHCRSMQLFKGVLNDLSRSSFEGKILVQQAAQKTDAFQLNNNLLLSDRAHADSKPNLEIFADDVKASHGATVGQLDREELFYMKTRGFSQEQAQKMLINSYCKEVLDLLPPL